MIRTFVFGHTAGNHQAVEAEADRLHNLGHEVITTIELDYPAEGWVAAMAVNLRELFSCDAISLLPGWEDWPESLVSHQAAVRLGLQIILAPRSEPYAMELIRAAVETDRLLAQIRARRATV
jgi:hypothetical protein